MTAWNFGSRTSGDFPQCLSNGVGGRRIGIGAFGMDVNSLPYSSNGCLLANQLSSVSANEHLIRCDPKLSTQEKSPDSGVAADGDTDTDSTAALECDRAKSAVEEKSASDEQMDEGGDEDDTGYASPASERIFSVPASQSNTSTTCEELRNALVQAVERENLKRAVKRTRLSLTGIGELLSKLRSTASAEDLASESSKERIVLDQFGNKVAAQTTQPSIEVSRPRAWSYHPEIIRTAATSEPAALPCRLQDGISLSDLPAPPPHPTDPEEIRKLVRSKMVRCKRCKNRFIEKNVYERHLRDKHPVDYLAFLIQQEEEIAEQRMAELEANRIEEIASGGYIPPEDEIVAESFQVNVNEIPLPGELSGGVPARFDGHGFLRQPKRFYRKKISPQCPFCDKRFRNEVSLKKHFAKKHPDSVEFTQCLRCFKAIRSKDDLPTHDCDLTYICFECTPMRNLCTQQRLFNHRAKFHRGANSGFKCNMCALKFLTPRKLRKHKKMAHVFTKTYSCHFCDELFTSECSVTTHERIHTGIIKFECRICDFKCNRFIRMEEHQKEEHGYICSVCQLKCAEWGALKNHTLQEHGGYLTIESNSGYIESPRVWVMYKGE
ncbi:Zinc finger and BTB domain-containing protein 16 [Toxocara canis]|uniref:Zinc finger and BTB domain-containing protein 16 n=1 Tax=Toxocara canis TaxID=6265 RepID=A0A0B2UWG5_TOXCA|nr:Zinc finger and BTB domain-containing protein 16 [Toxocara canis]